MTCHTKELGSPAENGPTFLGGFGVKISNCHSAQKIFFWVKWHSCMPHLGESYEKCQCQVFLLCADFKNSQPTWQSSLLFLKAIFFPNDEAVIFNQNWPKILTFLKNMIYMCICVHIYIYLCGYSIHPILDN